MHVVQFPFPETKQQPAGDRHRCTAGVSCFLKGTDMLACQCTQETVPGFVQYKSINQLVAFQVGEADVTH